MISASRRIPNFAGVALVDILANGVGVLIIVVILSIAARGEKEQHFAEKVREISTVMTREFSTKLVLNKLAASPPAMLHDYENSDIDQIWEPHVMPVLEFHPNVVRDPYSGSVWTRNELLQKPNSLDEFLSSLPIDARERVRGDIFDVGMYYLLMSQLREHNIRIAHWHFVGIGGGASAGQVSNCPPGFSYKDCASATGGLAANLPELPDLGETATSGELATSENESQWPPQGLGGTAVGSPDASDLATLGSGSVPEGALLGRSSESNGQGGAQGLGSFPLARAPSDVQGGQQGGMPGGVPGASGESSVRLRLADPLSEQQAPDAAFAIPLGQASLQSLIGALMLYVSDLQQLLDRDAPPTQLLQNLADQVVANMARQDQLTEEQLAIVEDLTFNIQTGSRPVARSTEPVEIIQFSAPTADRASLRLLPNRLIVEVEAHVDDGKQGVLPDAAVPRLSLNGYPDIWRGLQVNLERGSVVLASPIMYDAADIRWRAVAYLSPRVDDLIVGFVYGKHDEDGLLVIDADSNRVRVDNQELDRPADVAFFGVKAWLVTFYSALALAIFLLLVFWRPGLRRAV